VANFGVHFSGGLSLKPIERERIKKTVFITMLMLDYKQHDNIVNDNIGNIWGGVCVMMITRVIIIRVFLVLAKLKTKRERIVSQRGETKNDMW